jgi:BlaI family penicillinase repressor
MARKNPNHRFDLPPLELRCMRALWNLGGGTIHQIRAELLPDRPLAYTTVMTVMDRLARKGIAEREKRGRAHVYRPAVSEGTIRDHALNQFVEHFFKGSRDGLRRHLQGGVSASPAKSSPRPVQEKPAKSTEGGPATEAKTEMEIDTALL